MNFQIQKFNLRAFNLIPVMPVSLLNLYCQLLWLLLFPEALKGLLDLSRHQLWKQRKLFTALQIILIYPAKTIKIYVFCLSGRLKNIVWIVKERGKRLKKKKNGLVCYLGKFPPPPTGYGGFKSEWKSSLPVEICDRTVFILVKTGRVWFC